MKRFTDTDKWRDPWFRRLSPEHKLAWDYICTNCDNAGVWVVDWDLFEYLSGVTVNPDEILAAFGDRVRDIDNGRWWIPKFIPFQFGELVEASRVHQSVLALLKRHGLDTLWIGYLKGINTPKDKDKDKEKDKDKDACEVLRILNEASGVRFREVDSNLSIISARLNEPDVTVEGVRQMILRQCKLWKGTPQAEYLRPETLFRKSKFDAYYAMRDQAVNQDNGRNGSCGPSRNAGTLNDPSKYSAENLRKLPNYHGADKVPDANPNAPRLL